MCGIAGIINFDRDHPVDAQQIRAMNQVQSHRGPDDEGVFVLGNVGLGHRRLSVIDLKGGHQPMASADESLWVTFNGEIYNYVELRSRLISEGVTFRTHSDTEVLLKLYERKGEDCLAELSGMFAFTIVDLRQRRFFAARDRFGIKPYYYHADAEMFAFASEIKALLRLPGGRSDPDLTRVGEYLTFQFLLADRTLFKDVRKLMPGQCLSGELDHAAPLRLRSYWTASSAEISSDDENSLAEELLGLLARAVKEHVRSDVPLGAHLSGGLDSTVVACLAGRESGIPLKTFTGAFRDGPEFNESGHARLASNHCHSEYHEIFPTAQDFVEVLPRLIYHMDEPVAGPGMFPQYMVSRLAASHVKVVLGGQGGDELFGGYARYLAAYLEQCLKGAIFETQGREDQRFVVTFESLLPNLPLLRDYVPMLRSFWSQGLFESADRCYFRLIDRSQGMAEFFTPEFLASQDPSAVWNNFATLFNARPDDSLINRMTQFDMRTLLPALLQVEDRMSMACSIESRVPLLDHRIAEFMARIPPRIKFKGGEAKALFKRAVREVIPETILARKDKKGFPVPLTEWLHGPLKGFVHDLLCSRKSRERGIFSHAAIERLLSGEPRFGRQLWGLINLELWFQQFQDKVRAQ